PVKYCTDNAAMIAWAGIERLRLGLTDGLDFAPRPRWPLDPTAQPGDRASATTKRTGLSDDEAAAPKSIFRWSGTCSRLRPSHEGEPTCYSPSTVSIRPATSSFVPPTARLISNI